MLTVVEPIEALEGAPTPSAFEDERAVVLGAGMAGLAAAATLASRFGEVVVIDSDPIPEGPDQRHGVPQGAQMNNILAGGQQNLDILLGGNYVDTLLELGAGRARVSDQTHVNVSGRQMPEEDFGFHFVGAERPIAELAARNLLAQHENVAFQGLTEAVGLLVNRNTVGGVVLSGDEGEETLKAKVVVDATGARSNAPDWLAARGLQRPSIQYGGVVQLLASMIVERPSGYEEDEYWMNPPNVLQSKGGVIAPVAPGLWNVSVSGREQDGDVQVRTREALIAHAEQLSDGGVIADLVRQTEPIDGKVRTYRFSGVRRVDYDKLRRPIAGFFPVGDSFETHNPVYGQGTTAATWHARLLGVALDMYGDDLSQGAKSFIKDAAAVADEAEQSALDTARSVTERVGKGQYLVDLAADDPMIYEFGLRRLHMIDPTSLQDIAF